MSTPVVNTFINKATGDKIKEKSRFTLAIMIPPDVDVNTGTTRNKVVEIGSHSPNELAALVSEMVAYTYCKLIAIEGINEPAVVGLINQAVSTGLSAGITHTEEA